MVSIRLFFTWHVPSILWACYCGFLAWCWYKGKVRRHSVCFLLTLNYHRCLMSQRFKWRRNHLICNLFSNWSENFESLTVFGLTIQIILFFGNKHFVNIVQIFDLIKVAVLMLEQAALTVRAEQPIGEGCASLRFILIVVYRRRFTHQFMLSMSELAFVAVPTQPHFDPIFAHLSLILRLVYFLDLVRWQKRLCVKMKLAVGWMISQLIRHRNFNKWIYLWHYLGIIRVSEL